MITRETVGGCCWWRFGVCLFRLRDALADGYKRVLDECGGAQQALSAIRERCEQ